MGERELRLLILSTVVLGRMALRSRHRSTSLATHMTRIALLTRTYLSLFSRVTMVVAYAYLLGLCYSILFVMLATYLSCCIRPHVMLNPRVAPSWQVTDIRHLCYHALLPPVSLTCYLAFRS